MAERDELGVLAASVHGALTALHLLGLFYNIRRGQKLGILAHGLWCAYDAVAAIRHWREGR